jgi:hypothetical protein
MTMTGLLSGLDEVLAKLKDRPPSPPETPEERQAAEAKLDAAIGAAVQQDWDREIADWVGPVLERKYEIALGEIY